MSTTPLKLKRTLWNFIKVAFAICACISAVGLGQTLGFKIAKHYTANADMQLIAAECLSAMLAVSAYFILYTAVKKQKAGDLSVGNFVPDVIKGIAVGTAFQSLVVLIIYLCGDLTVVSVNSISATLPFLLICIAVAVAEEILFRGVVFRLIEEKLGSYAALVISSLFFGVVHLSNDNSSLFAALAISIEAGLLLGLAYMYTRNLWFPIAIHFAWNYTQSGVFGANTSGLAVNGTLLTTKMHGNELITGGAFGPEATIQSIILGLIASSILFVLCRKRDRIVSR